MDANSEFSFQIWFKIFIWKLSEKLQVQRHSTTSSVPLCTKYYAWYSMRSSWMHMFMVSLWNVETESSGGFSPGSSVTSLIILKSAWKKDLSVSVLTYISIRILLACIRFLASCPCPRCFTKKKDIAAMGTTIDTQRCAKVRRDDEHTQNKVDNTRR